MIYTKKVRRNIMTVKVKCVHCGVDVKEWDVKCPSCGKPVANKDAPTNVSKSPATWKASGSGKKSSMPMIIGVVVVISAIATVLFLFVLK